MPVKSDITMEDVGKAIIPTLVPLGIAGLGWYVYSRKKDQVEWFEKLRKPSWVISDTCTQMGIDFACLAPVGLAAHLVCKEARGQDRQVALSLYGAGLLVWLAGIPAFAQNRNLKCWGGIELLAAGVFGATAAAFYKVNNTAGLLLVPLTTWLAYSAVGFFCIDQSTIEQMKPK